MDRDKQFVKHHITQLIYKDTGVVVQSDEKMRKMRVHKE